MAAHDLNLNYLHKSTVFILLHVVTSDTGSLYQDKIMRRTQILKTVEILDKRLTQIYYTSSSYKHVVRM